MEPACNATAVSNTILPVSLAWRQQSLCYRSIPTESSSNISFLPFFNTWWICIAASQTIFAPVCVLLARVYSLADWRRFCCISHPFAIFFAFRLLWRKKKLQVRKEVISVFYFIFISFTYISSCFCCCWKVFSFFYTYSNRQSKSTISSPRCACHSQSRLAFALSWCREFSSFRLSYK